MARTALTSNIKYLSSAEFRDLIVALKTADPSSKFHKRNIAAFLIAEYCGLRASELGLIRISDYDPNDKVLRCRRLKGSVSNVLKIIDPEVLAAMEQHYFEYLKKPDHSQYLFASKSGKPLDRRTLDVLMKFYCSFTSISPDKHHFHTLKHTRAMQMIATPGVNLRDVQWWLGHKYIANTMIYLNYSVEAQAELYKKLENNLM